MSSDWHYLNIIPFRIQYYVIIIALQIMISNSLFLCGNYPGIDRTIKWSSILRFRILGLEALGKIRKHFSEFTNFTYYVFALSILVIVFYWFILNLLQKFFFEIAWISSFQFTHNLERSSPPEYWFLGPQGIIL